MKNKVSFIIPLYNEEKRVLLIIDFYHQLKKIFNHNFEIICVLNGCYDNTHSILIQNIKDEIITVSTIKIRSRGAAIKKGINLANNDLIAIGSVDNAWDISFYNSAHDYLNNYNNLSVVYGPKSHFDSIVKRPLIRKIISFFCTLYLKLLFGKLFYEDTQCIKMFKKKDIIFLNQLSNSNYFAEAEFFFYSKIYKLNIKFIKVSIRDTKKTIKLNLLLGFMIDALIFRIKLYRKLK